MSHDPFVDAQTAQKNWISHWMEHPLLVLKLETSAYKKKSFFKN